MDKNMGKIDRWVRVIFALVVNALYFADVITGTFGLVMIVISIVFVLTSVTSFCPIYKIIGINSCAAKKD
jgi:uncharacterized membrane protein